MIHKADEPDEKRVFGYIGTQYEECLYLYINLKKYGTKNPNVSLWIDEENGGICGVYLKYFDCIHFYTEEKEYSLNNMLELIAQEKPQVVFMPERIGNLVRDKLSSHFEMECMEIMMADQVAQKESGAAKRAQREDIPVIVDFLMTDKIYTDVYDRQTVLKQFLERYDDGFSRFHFIQEQGEVIACAGTNAELDDVVIIGGILTAPSHRKQGLGMTVLSSLWNEINAEGKKGFSFISAPESKKLHQRLGFYTIGKVAKFHSA